jgi:hypothetical protein
VVNIHAFGGDIPQCDDDDTGGPFTATTLLAPVPLPVASDALENEVGKCDFRRHWPEVTYLRCMFSFLDCQLDTSAEETLHFEVLLALASSAVFSVRHSISL